ncbi:MAG: sucrase ferredoxin [Myxococcales bacterium]|nr:sucrase ferredoxin [Myxococcales bacterium]
MASLVAGEPIAGSAAERTSVWIVLEHRGPWGAKAVRDSDLSEAVKQRLGQWEQGVPGSRVQLVRRSGRTEGPLRMWLGVSDPARPRMVERVLGDDAEALLQVDAPAIVAALRRGEAIEGWAEPAVPMVLVCTNGRRDVCCSVHGVPVARAFEAEAGVETWHTTHLGGHRFAATLLELPRGLCYGRVLPHEVPALAEAIRNGRVGPLDRLRGRMALAGPEQAAEALWRERSGNDVVDALVGAEHVAGEDVTVVTLHDREGGRHELRVRWRDLGIEAPPSCGKAPESVGGWVAAE